MTEPLALQDAPGARQRSSAWRFGLVAAVLVTCGTAVHDAGAQQPAASTRPAPVTGEPRKCDQEPGNAPGKKIFYGAPDPNEKSAIGISFRQNGRPSICTGVVISPSAILTAGHCSCGTDYLLRFGEQMSAPEASLPVRRIARFPGYDCSRHLQNQPGVDYAVMTFDANAVPADESGERARPMPVMAPKAAQRSVLRPSSSLYAVGYGYNENLQTGYRLGADIPVLSWDCAERWAETRGCQPFSEMILSELGLGFRADGRNRDSCGGDSGGPVMARSVETDSCTNQPVERRYLVGITSRGMRLNQGEGGNKICGGGGIYEVVARNSVIDWLARNGIPLNVQTVPPADR